MVPALAIAAVRRWRDRPGVILLLGALVTAALILLDIANPDGNGPVFRALYVVIAPSAASLTLVVLARRSGRSTLRYGPLAAAVAMTALAMASLDLVPLVGASVAAIAASVCFVFAAALALAVITPVLVTRMDRSTGIAAGLDTGIMFVAGATVLITIWSADIAAAAPRGLVVPLLLAALAGSALMASVAALAMRAVPTNRGFWIVIPGVTLLGFCWIIWVYMLLQGETLPGLVSGLFAAGILAVAFGWMAWDQEVVHTRPFEAAARWLTDWVPMASLMLCAAIEAIPHGRIAGMDPAPVGTAVVVLLAMVRQRLLVVGERLALRRLAGEVDERAQAMLSLARLEKADTLALTSLRICGEALRLPGIDAARIYTIGAAGVVPMALEGIQPEGEVVGEAVEPGRGQHIRECAAAGTWVDSTPATRRPEPGKLLGEAFAPMRWEDRIVGVVSMGTTEQLEAQRLATRLPTVSEFGVVSAALIGPRLAEQRRRDDIRAELNSIIADHAFVPVFQAVVELGTRRTVGFEALTRFRDGARPDQRFIEADLAGMSIKLETACIADQVEAACWLPAGTWVSLNVSPALAGAIIPIIAALERVDREVVLEITEHVEIADYKALVGALNLVRGKARLAVDDAGAGYAGLRHILELHPQFVKLDLSLVRHIDTDPARQAMVAGMAHFARNSGCELIAEGIETEAELDELIRLGVPLGQGYLFGKPGPAMTA